MPILAEIQENTQTEDHNLAEYYSHQGHLLRMSDALPARC